MEITKMENKHRLLKPTLIILVLAVGALTMGVGSCVFVSPIVAVIDVGETVQLSAQSHYDTAFTWQSGNSSVAGVDQAGRVTGRSHGYTWISAVGDSSGHAGKAKVVVRRGDGVPASVTVTPGTSTIEKGDTVQLSASASDPDDTSFTWSSNNTDAATVDSTGMVTGVAEGNATITATGSNSGASDTATVTVTVPGAFQDADLERGGALYDNWWAAAGVAEPTTDHPLWGTRPDTVSNTRTGTDTWRCKECHGWDYKGVDGAYGSGSHRTGFPGIFGVEGGSLRAKSATDIFDTIKTTHSFGDLTDLTDDDIWNLTKFVLEGQLDTDDIIDTQGAFVGDVAVGQTLYSGNCAVCHGADGLTPPPGHPEFDAFPGTIADDNPWEFQHKVSYGQPSTAMPPQALNLTVEEVGDLGAFAQTLPTEPAPQEFEDADLERGGALYDKWWAAAGVAEPTTDHPLWGTRPDTVSNTRTGTDTWRCKECHGWDYKGVDGAYGSGSHRTGFPGIFGVEGGSLRAKSATDIFDTIKTTHSFGDLTDLTDDDIWNLTKFVLEGQLDTDDIIDTQGAFIGSTAQGQTLYGTNCTVCHGADGLTAPPGADPGFDAFPGTIADDNPWEFQHKVSYGQPGTVMPGLAENLSVGEIGDLGAHAQTLPTE
jgi:mono/diheme cytochrome c family protein